jgi:uncharacterized protein YcbK (DUF882 family)
MCVECDLLNSLEWPDRRGFMLTSAAILAMTALPEIAAAANTDRSLSFFRYHGGAKLAATYYRSGKYDRAVLNQINLICKDQLQKQHRQMDVRLIDYVHEVKQAVNPKGQVIIISAFRTPKTNAWLRRKSKNVAKKSWHTKGQAMDIRIEGVGAGEVAEAARALRMGGVGLYTRSGFVHLDTGPPRSWTA